MAWIKSVQRTDGTGRLQPTEVTAHIKVFQAKGGTTIVQIDTHGSTERENPGKQSQTIQFGREAAQQLYTILKDAYGF